MSKRTPTDESSSPNIDEMDTPFHQFSTEKQEALATRLNEDEELSEDRLSLDLYQLLLVLWDVRPACILCSASHTTSREAAVIQAHLPQEYGFDNPVENLLRDFNIPFYRDVNLYEADGKVQVSKNYYVTFDQQRREMIKDQISEGSPWDPPSRKDDAIIGEFLGYPDQAIRAFCTSWHAGGETFFDQLSDEELLERLGPTRQYVEKLEGESTAFVKVFLPYVVPATVEDIDHPAISDFEKFFAVGIVSLSEYNIQLIYRVLKYYWNIPREGEWAVPLRSDNIGG